MIEMLVLGAGGAVPTTTHSPAAYWLNVDGIGLLLDPGPGALVRLLKDGRGPASLDGVDRVLMTHLHLDHCADLAPLLFALHSPVLVSVAPITIAGPVGLAEYLERLRELYDSWLEPSRRELVLRELDTGQRLDLASLAPSASAPAGVGPDEKAGTGAGPFVETFAADHPQDRFATRPLLLRFTDKGGNTLVYSGDTTLCDDLVAASRNADLVVVECSTSRQWALAGHMNPELVAELCRRAEPRRVALTHQYPDAVEGGVVADIHASWNGEVVALRDGDRLAVPDIEEHR
jgi:ribonuclease BN (tRNA processing enzyme)